MMAPHAQRDAPYGGSETVKLSAAALAKNSVFRNLAGTARAVNAIWMELLEQAEGARCKR
jgi:hypothetical protein